MPHLNWKELPVSLDFSSHQLTLGLRVEELKISTESLEPLCVGESPQLGVRGPELRLSLPGWVLFWKRGGSESRILLAHPSPDEWVATLALETEFFRTMVAALQRLETGQSLMLSQLGSLGRVSNLDVVIRV